MTPQERELVSKLFDRLADLEGAQRDPDAERAIAQGLARAPNAVYTLVQTCLVQDEALKAANAHIQELEAALDGEPETDRKPGFLDNVRETLFGRPETPGRVGSVPSVPPGYRAAPPPPPTGFGGGPPSGGSFLGTAAASAAGAIGGSLLLDGIRSALGAHHGGPFAGAFDRGSADSGPDRSPWQDASSSDLAHRAGIDDVGHDHPERVADSDQDDAAGPNDDSDQPPDDDDDFDDSFDDGGNDSDYA